MYSPFLVLPYQRSPSLWNTFVSLLTQTWPLPPPGACVAAGVFVFLDLAAEAGADGAAGGAAAGVPTVTIGVILAMVDLLTPARSRSDTLAMGRAATIFRAAAGPTPGRLSRSAWVPWLRSTILDGADAAFLAVSFAAGCLAGWAPICSASARVINEAVRNGCIERVILKRFSLALR